MSWQKLLSDLGAHLEAQDQRITDLQTQIGNLSTRVLELEADDFTPDPPPVDNMPSENVRVIQEFRPPVSANLVDAFNRTFDNGAWQQDWTRFAYAHQETLRIRQHAPLMHADGRLSWNFTAQRPGADHGQVILQDMDRGDPDRLPEGMFLRAGVTYQMQWSARWEGIAWPSTWVQLMQGYGMHGAPQADGRKDQIGVFAKNSELQLITHDNDGIARATPPITYPLITNQWYTFAVEFRASGEETDFASMWAKPEGKTTWEWIDRHEGPIGTGRLTHEPDGYLGPRVGFYGSGGVKVSGSIRDICLAEVIR